MNEYKIILKALSTLAVNHSLETVTGIFSESELANAIKKLVLVNNRAYSFYHHFCNCYCFT